MDTFISMAPQSYRNELAARWQELQVATEECALANEINGLMIRNGQRQIEELTRLVSGQVATDVYGSDAKRRSMDSGNSLDIA
jgi:flagellar biosynthesis/type III secretory pathway chaperone